MSRRPKPPQWWRTFWRRTGSVAERDGVRWTLIECGAADLVWRQWARPRSDAEIRANLDSQYAATHLRLNRDPEYRRLVVAARAEEAETPHLWLARHHLALYVEVEMDRPTPPAPNGDSQ